MRWVNEKTNVNRLPAVHNVSIFNLAPIGHIIKSDFWLNLVLLASRKSIFDFFFFVLYFKTWETKIGLGAKKPWNVHRILVSTFSSFMSFEMFEFFLFYKNAQIEPSVHHKTYRMAKEKKKKSNVLFSYKRFELKFPGCSRRRTPRPNRFLKWAPVTEKIGKHCPVPYPIIVKFFRENMRLSHGRKKVRSDSGSPLSVTFYVCIQTPKALSTEWGVVKVFGPSI